MMDGDAIKQIQEGYRPTALAEVEGFNYLFHDKDFTKAMHTTPTPQPLEINTLSGVLQYLDGNEENLLVHIESYHIVSLVSELDEKYRTRECHVVADCRDRSHYRSNNYVDLETFIIMLMSGFEQDENTEKLLAFLGSIRSEDVSKNEDDGISQSVMVRAGVTTMAQVEVPNPVFLTPFMTFPEIAQPTRPFVFRMKKGHETGDMPSCAIFETDDTHWKLDCVVAIREYIKENLKNARIVS